MRVLLVEDDRDQRELRRMLLQHSGYEVDGCTMPIEAEAACANQTPDVVVMDLRLPTAADGRELVRALRARHPQLPIIVCTGWAGDLEGTPEKDSVQAVLRKPIRSEELVKLISQFVLKTLAFLFLIGGSLNAQEVLRLPFELAAAAEAAAAVTLSAPDADWSRAGDPGSIAEIRVDDGPARHLVVASGAIPVQHEVFLGSLASGRHVLTVRRADGANLKADSARVRPLDPARIEDLAVLHAPALHLRANTLGRYSDVPMIAYATSGMEGALRWFEYTVVFSNEDGGTSSRNLMARWGRASDIEYVYKVWLDAKGQRRRTLIQTRDHKDVDYEGEYEGGHPVLVPVTNNNMVEPASNDNRTPYRVQLAPFLLDLLDHSRELAMDRHPWTYRVVADELLREGQLRAPMTVDGEKISDPRNYLTFEFRSRLRFGAVQVLVRRRNERDWHASSVGLPENFIDRQGWARVAIELPPGTKPPDIAEVGFQCGLRRDARSRSAPTSGECTVEAVGRVFFLNADALPGPSLTLDVRNMSMKTGGLRTVALP